VRRNVEWLTADPVSSINFTPLHELDGIITPNGICFERHHGGTAQINPADHRLMINGLVDTPLVFTMEDLKRFPRQNHVYFLECAANSGMEWRGSQLNGCQYTHGMVHNVMYTGIPLKTLLEEAGVKTNGKWVLPEGADASAMTRSVPIEKAMDDCLVAFKMNGEALRPEQGYPLRLVVPGWEGNMWVKWLRRLEIGDEPWHQREETSKYTDLLANGKARRFTWVMDPKSVITSPEPAGADHPRQGPAGHLRRGMVRQRQDHPRRCLHRRRPQLEDRTYRRPEPVQVDAPFLSRHQLGRVRRFCSSPARWTSMDFTSRPRTSCAPHVARTRSTTTTASRPGMSKQTGRLKMSKLLKTLCLDGDPPFAPRPFARARCRRCGQG
jgi:DMSO/TMAO reductase YedYZ molybdopterin-dependent catalytic subunit